MEDYNQAYIVYVKTNERNLIISVNSSAFLFNVSGWTEIDKGYTQRYHHAQSVYFSLPIMDERGIYRYKLEDGKAVERNQEEMDADYIKQINPPSQLDIIEAQITYTAMMTDTLLEM